MTSEVSATVDAGAESRDDAYSKRLRGLQKKLRQATALQEEHASGKELNASQQQKVVSIPELQREIQQLEESGPAGFADELGTAPMPSDASPAPADLPPLVDLSAAAPPAAGEGPATGEGAAGSRAAQGAAAPAMAPPPPGSVLAYSERVSRDGGGRRSERVSPPENGVAGGSLRPSGAPRSSSRASWEDADLIMPDEPAPAPAQILTAPDTAPGKAGGASANPALASAASAARERPSPPPLDVSDRSGVRLSPPEEEVMLMGPSSANGPKSPGKEAWGGGTSWRAKDGARGGLFSPRGGPSEPLGSPAGPGAANEVIDKLYRFKSKAPIAERANAAVQSVTGKGELRHLDQSSSLSSGGPAVHPTPASADALAANASVVMQPLGNQPLQLTPHPRNNVLLGPPGVGTWSKGASAVPPAAQCAQPPPSQQALQPSQQALQPSVYVPPLMVLPPSIAPAEAPAIDPVVSPFSSRTASVDSVSVPPGVFIDARAPPGAAPGLYPAYDAAIVAAAAATLAALDPLDDSVVAACANATLDALVASLEAEAVSMRSLTMEDFELLRLVGKGGYGKVFQVRCKLNEMVYAMKVVDKASIEKYRSMDNIATELSILRTHAESRHPFILGLECAFQSESKLHFVMEYVPGGMLFAHLRSHEMFSEKMARFYAAEVMLGLQHLHALSIIYRDLKPENVLICADGNVKLCDFGLAAIGLTAPATHTSASGRPVLVGTTEYMAPEVLRRMQCGQAVDVWALGVLLYEMVTGEAPWWHKEQKELQRKIAHTKLRLPTWLTNEAKSIIRGLLTKDPAARLGVKEGSAAYTSDFDALKSHVFFRNLNFRMLAMCKLEAPFIPNLASPLDVSNFDSKYTLEAPVLSPLRRPLSADMAGQFEALALAYLSPDARDSMRHSLRVSTRLSCDSTRDSASSRDSRVETY